MKPKNKFMACAAAGTKPIGPDEQENRKRQRGRGALAASTIFQLADRERDDLSAAADAPQPSSVSKRCRLAGCRHAAALHLEKRGKFAGRRRALPPRRRSVCLFLPFSALPHFYLERGLPIGSLGLVKAIL